MDWSKSKTVLEADASLLALEKMELFYRKFMEFYKVVEDPQADLYDWGDDGEWAISFMGIELMPDNYFTIYYSTVKGFKIFNENLCSKDEIDHDIETNHESWPHSTHDPEEFLTSVDIYLMDKYYKAEEELIMFRKILQDSRLHILDRGEESE